MMSTTIETNDISSEYAVNRMFELVMEGRTGDDEYVMLDNVIRARLLQAYDDGHLEATPRAQTAD